MHCCWVEVRKGRENGVKFDSGLEGSVSCEHMDKGIRETGNIHQGFGTTGAYGMPG
jgi:hypothetical protein